MHACERRGALRRVEAGAAGAWIVPRVTSFARERDDAAGIVAGEACRAIAGGPALRRADPAATEERARAIRVERAGQPGGGTAGVGAVARESALRGELVRVRTGAGHTQLALHAVTRRDAGVAALPVDAADLAHRAIAVRPALALDTELADVERTVARHAALPRIAVARRLARSVAALKGTDQRRIAVAVDGAVFREPRSDAVRIRTAADP